MVLGSVVVLEIHCHLRSAVVQLASKLPTSYCNLDSDFYHLPFGGELDARVHHI